MEQKYAESPEVISWVDSAQSLLTVQFTIIEATPEDITLMMDEKGCYLSANTPAVEYVAALSFLHPVKPEEAKATYKDGYLTATVPFKDPLTNYIKVPVE